MKKTVLLATIVLLLVCCATPAPRASETGGLQELSLELSGPGGYFDTDNLLTNEDSFQHVLPVLDKVGVRGGAYIGVGPGQNLTYIAHQKPELALLVDLRSDNRLLMLYLRALFLDSADRWQYLSALLGRPLALETEVEDGAAASRLVEVFSRLPPDAAYFDRVWKRAWQRLEAETPLLLEAGDDQRLRSMVEAFVDRGLGLRFRSHGRSPRRDYPTFAQLMTETDSRGRPRHYLQREEDFQFLRDLHRRKRIVPVVGDVAGSESLKKVAALLRHRSLEVTAFYVSNVEFYLFADGRFEAFVRNLENLPSHEKAILVRSYFGYGFRHPLARPGYRVTSICQYVDSFLDQHRRSPYYSYADLVLRDYLESPD